MSYRIGKGRPPKHSRYKKGTTGNLRGRPKGSRNLATILAAELKKKVVVREGDRTRRVRKAEALIISTLAKGMSGDSKAANTVFAMQSKHEGEVEQPKVEELFADNEIEILRTYGPRLLKQLEERKKTHDAH